MPKTIDAIIKIDNKSSSEIADSIQKRLEQVFSKVKATRSKSGETVYRGGQSLKPYGFKAEISLEELSEGATVVRLAGRPTMRFLAVVCSILAICFLAYGLTYPINGFYGLIAAAIIIVVLVLEQKKTTKQLKQFLEELKLIHA